MENSTIINKEKLVKNDASELTESTEKKSEKNVNKRSIIQSYKLVWSILKLDAIRKLILIFLTVRVSNFKTHLKLSMQLLILLIF